MSAGRELNGVLRMCLDGDGVLWLVRSEDIRCAQVVYDAGGRASVGWGADAAAGRGGVHPLRRRPDDLFTDPERHILFRFDTGQRRAFPIFRPAEELGRRGTAFASVIRRQGRLRALAFGMSGVLRLRSTDPIEGRYELQEIDVNCGVFALLKDCNQDIVWIGTDSQAAGGPGRSRIRSPPTTLPLPADQAVKALHVDPEGATSGSGTKNDGILRIRDFYPADLYAGEYHSYTAADSPLGKNSVYTFAGSRRNVLWIGGDGGVLLLVPAQADFRTAAGGRCGHSRALRGPGRGVLWAASVGYGVWRIELSGSADAPVAANVEPVELGLKARAGTSFSPFARSPIPPSGSATTVSASYTYDRRTREGRTVGFDTRRGLAVNDVTAGVCRSDGSSWFRDRLRPGALRSGGRRRGIRLQQRPAALRGDPRPAGRFARQHLGRDQCRHRALRPGDEPFGGFTALRTDLTWSSSATEPIFTTGSRGKLLFGGINGFVVISDSRDSEAASLHAAHPVPRGEGQRRGRTMSGALMRRGRMVLRHHQNAFSLSIAALDYVNGSNYSYFYNIEGLDGDWHDNYHSNTLAFAAFPRAAIRSGCATGTIRPGVGPVSRLPIRVLAPPYASTWAWIRVSRRNAGRRYRRVGIPDPSPPASDAAPASRSTNSGSGNWSMSRASGRSQPDQRTLDPRDADKRSLSADHGLQVGRRVRPPAGGTDPAQCAEDQRFDLYAQRIPVDRSVDGSDDIEMLDVSRTAGGIAQSIRRLCRGEPHRLPDGRRQRRAVPFGAQYPDDDLQYPAVQCVPPDGAGRVGERFGRDLRPCRVRTGRLPAPGRTSGAAERLRIEVSNRGVELDAGQIELIFDRYKLFNHLGALSRQGVSLKEDLELTICYNLVTKLQGEFRVESRDGLTTFTLSLPRLEITRAARSAAQPDIAPGQRFSLPVPVPEASVMTFGDMLPDDARHQRGPGYMADFIAGLFSGGATTCGSSPT